jgi:hypothetical protein
MSDVPRLVSVLEAAIAAADARTQADAAIIANLQRQLEQANNRAYQAEQAADLLQAAFDQSCCEMQAQLEQHRTETEAEKEARREAVEELHAWQAAWQDRLAADDTARRARGRLARAWRAWRGE